MANNKYPDHCIHCKQWTLKGKGYFHRHNGKWLLRCASCVDKVRQECENNKISIIEKIIKDSMKDNNVK